MKLLPQSLFGRLVTALVLVVAAAALVIAILLSRERREMVFWGGDSSELIEFLAATTEELAGLPARERSAHLQRLQREPVIITDAASRSPRRPPKFDDVAAARTYERRLQRELGDDYDVRVRPALRSVRGSIRINFGRPRRPLLPEPPADAPPPPTPPGLQRSHELDVVVRLPDGGRVAYRVPAPRSGAPMPSRIFLELALLTAVLAAVLFFMTRSITRPLSALADAADAMSRGESPAPLPEVGATELKEATHAFNTMHERLQRYLDSRTQLLAAMSHDLRTPLTRLRLRAERLDDAALKAQMVADVEEMTSMIRATLKLFQGLNDDEPQTSIDVMAFLRQLACEFADVGADVAIEGHANAPLDAKPMALKRCLENLLNNAVKYGHRATVRVEDGDVLVIRVLDEGPGIPAASLETVFQPFYRLERSRNPATGGTGLGLSIARDVAQAHGGTLVLKNRQPRGLEAVLSLPRTRATTVRA